MLALLLICAAVGYVSDGPTGAALGVLVVPTYLLVMFVLGRIAEAVAPTVDIQPPRWMARGLRLDGDCFAIGALALMTAAFSILAVRGFLNSPRHWWASALLLGFASLCGVGARETYRLYRCGQ